MTGPTPAERCAGRGRSATCSAASVALGSRAAAADEPGELRAGDRGRGARVPGGARAPGRRGRAGPRPGPRWSRAGSASATACSTAAGPMLRGDDVAELQRRLNALGFDAGREDGILGDDTARGAARVPAQHRTCAADGIVRPGDPRASSTGSAALADGLGRRRCASARQLRRGPRRLADHRVFVAAAPGFETLGDVVVRGLVELGRRAPRSTLSGDDDSVLAAEANQYARRPVPRASAPATRRAAAAATSRPATSAPRPGSAVAERGAARSSPPILGGEPRAVRPDLRGPARDPDGRGRSASRSASDDVEAHAHARRRRRRRRRTRSSAASGAASSSRPTTRPLAR